MASLAVVSKYIRRKLGALVAARKKPFAGRILSVSTTKFEGGMLLLYIGSAMPPVPSDLLHVY